MPSLRLSPIIAVVSLVLSVPAVPAGAQERRAPEPAPTRDSVVKIPEAMMPPAGKCRIWMLNVPAKQQPAATDCTTAMRQKPANAVLVFGPAVRDLSPFEARESWRRATEKEDEREPTRGRTNRDTAGGSDERRGRDDSATAVPARPVESRDAESRRAEPQKAEPQRAEPQKSVPKRPEPRKPEAQKVERRPSTSPKVERRPTTPPQVERRASPPPTRTPPTPTKKPERP